MNEINEVMNQVPPRTGPSIARGSSRQDFATPKNFVAAVNQRFGYFAWDLAANKDNALAFGFYTEEQNALVQDWHNLSGLLWLNPPFANIGPWAKKCRDEAALGADILMLVPASVGSNWFAEYVHGQAKVYFLSPRPCFDGKNPYPKDCMLIRWDHQHHASPYECWRWM